MKIPLIIWVVFWIYLLPLAVALRRPSRLRGPLLGVAIWLALRWLANATLWSWSHLLDRGNNQFISYIFLPLESVVLLWTIAEWQVIPVLRTTVRMCIPLLLIWWLIDVAFFEDLANTSLFGYPVHGMLVLTTALVALVTRTGAAEEPVLTQDWFWILGGIALMFATGAVVSILKNTAIAAGDWAFADLVTRLKAGIDIVGLLAITGGFLWHSRPAYSGVSSSPARSP